MSEFKELSDITQESLLSNLKVCNNVRVKIIAYCLMPTHIHLVLEQTGDRGVEKFMGRVLNAYARYFNTKHGRQGPLWSSRFKSVLVKDDDQLLHLTRYIHLNPVSADLVEKPENWKWSSYLQYIEKTGLCDFQDRLDIEPKRYKKFVDDRKAYQKSLSKIKSLIIENYSD